MPRTIRTAAFAPAGLAVPGRLARLPRLAVLAVLPVLLGGCAGGTQEAEARTAISDYLIAQQDDGRMMPLERVEADCIAGDMVDGIGVDGLQGYGLLDEDVSVDEQARSPEMSQEDSQVMVDAMFDCTDVMQAMRDQLATATGGQSPEVQQCLDGALTEQLVRDVLASTFAGDAAGAQRQLMAPLGDCLAADTDVPGQG
jgi:hypothetical protein